MNSALKLFPWVGLVLMSVLVGWLLRGAGSGSGSAEQSSASPDRAVQSGAARSGLRSDGTRASSEWGQLNASALERYAKKDPAGAMDLAALLSRNLNERRGVDLRGVDLSLVLSLAPHAESGTNLAGYLAQPTADPLSKFWGFENCLLESSKPPGVPMVGMSMVGAEASPALWQEWASSLGGRGLEGANLAGVDLGGLNLDGIRLRFSDLSGTGVRPFFADGVFDRFEGANLAGANFVGVDLSSVSLRYANLVGTLISPAQLATAARSLGGSGLRGAALPRVDLSAENLAGVVLQFSDLRSVSMTRAQFDGVAAAWNGMGAYGAQPPPSLSVPLPDTAKQSGQSSPSSQTDQSSSSSQLPPPPSNP